MKTIVQITMPDRSVWEVPVLVIAKNRAAHYADREFDGDVERSLKEDTLPLFAAHPAEISDWGRNNMNWDEVAHVAKRINQPELTERDKQDGWVNGLWSMK